MRASNLQPLTYKKVSANSSLKWKEEGRKSIIGTFIGSMEEAQEMLEFCKEKGLTSMIEMVKMEYVNQAMERLAANSEYNPLNDEDTNKGV